MCWHGGDVYVKRAGTPGDGYAVGHQPPHISDPTPGKPRGVGVEAAFCMPSQPHTEAHGPSPHHTASWVPLRVCKRPRFPHGAGALNAPRLEPSTSHCSEPQLPPLKQNEHRWEWEPVNPARRSQELER